METIIYIGDKPDSKQRKQAKKAGFTLKHLKIKNDLINELQKALSKEPKRLIGIDSNVREDKPTRELLRKQEISTITFFGSN